MYGSRLCQPLRCFREHRRDTAAAYRSLHRALAAGDWHRMPGTGNEGGSAHPKQVHDCAALRTAGEQRAGERGGQRTFDWRCWNLRMNFSEYAQHEEAWYSWALGLTQHGVAVLSLATEDLLVPTRGARTHAAPTLARNPKQPSSGEGRNAAGRSGDGGSGGLTVSGGESDSGGSGVGSAGGGPRRRLLNLTLLRRVTDFLEVAPSMRPRDVSLSKMALPGWFEQSETGAHPISLLV